MMGRLRRMRWINWPMPMEAVSPSPLTPKASRLRLASIAPVAMEGMRPCTALKLGYALRLHAHVVHGVNDALGNGIVPATGAQGSFPALVVEGREADAVGLL